MKNKLICILLTLALMGSLALPAQAVDELDAYIAEHITSSMTLRQKLDVICQFVAGYDYSPYASTMADMLASGGGDSYAGSETLLAFCRKLGIQASLRSSQGDGNGTMVNVLVEGDGVYYQLETGFQEIAPRPYEIVERTSLFSYRFISGGVEVYQYDGSSPWTLNLPEELDGHKVVALGDRFLADCSSVSKVTLPSTLKTIGDDAFNGCVNLTTLDIPAGVTSLGERVFAGCNALQNLTSSSESFRMVDHVLYNEDMTEVLAGPYCKVAVLPNSVTSIVPYAFHCSGNLEAVVVGSGVRSIGEGAFADCGRLSMITFQGLEPELGEFLFFAVTSDAYAGWECTQSASGSITWNSYTPTAEYSAEYDEQANVTKLHIWVWGEGRVLIPMQVTELAVEVTMESKSAVLDAVLKTPSHGYVFLKNGTVLPQTKVTDQGISLGITESCSLVIRDESETFPDLNPNSWIRPSVDYLTARGLMSGKLDGTFCPDEVIQRQTVAMMLWRIAGRPEVEGTSPFPDITGGRYLTPVLWAYQNGIIAGYDDGTFRPEDPITRQHFVLMLRRYAKLKGITLEKQDNGLLTDFADYDRMNRRMYEAIQWGLDYGMVLGRANGYYEPEAGITRGQMAAILVRLLKQVY